VPTATPLPPTVTVTPVPTLTSTVKPSATPKLTATITESPTATAAPTEKGPPPEGFADWAEARKYGWVENAAGKSEQHMVKDKDGHIIFGDLTMELLEAKYEDHRFMYRIPDVNGKNIAPNFSFETFEPENNEHLFAFTFHVLNQKETFEYLGIYTETFVLEVRASNGVIYTLGSTSIQPVYSQATDPEGIYGFIIAVPTGVTVESIRQARGPEGPRSVVYEAQK